MRRPTPLSQAELDAEFSSQEAEIACINAKSDALEAKIASRAEEAARHRAQCTDLRVIKEKKMVEAKQLEGLVEAAKACFSEQVETFDRKVDDSVLKEVFEVMLQGETRREDIEADYQLARQTRHTHPMLYIKLVTMAEMIRGLGGDLCIWEEQVRGFEAEMEVVSKEMQEMRGLVEAWKAKKGKKKVKKEEEEVGKNEGDMGKGKEGKVKERENEKDEEEEKKGKWKGKKAEMEEEVREKVEAEETDDRKKSKARKEAQIQDEEKGPPSFLSDLLSPEFLLREMRQKKNIDPKFCARMEILGGKVKELVDLNEWPLPPKRTSWVMVQRERKRQKLAEA